MTINDLTPQERMLLFLMRLSDALPPPRVKPDIEEESKGKTDFWEKMGQTNNV